jgi:hypothetical protein
MKKYTYNDWYSGKVRLDTCFAVYPEGVQPIQIVYLNEFSEKDIFKIKNKQKELFEIEKEHFKKVFLDLFSKRFKNSKQKDILLIREIKQCKDILTTKVLEQNYKTPYTFPHTKTVVDGKYLAEYYEYYKDHIINGVEIQYNFIHSPNFLYKDVSSYNTKMFAQALIEFLELLNSVKRNRILIVDKKKREKESYEKIFNSSFDFCKSLKEFQTLLRINNNTVTKNECLKNLADYKSQYSKALKHYHDFSQKNDLIEVFESILSCCNTEIGKILETIEKSEKKPNNNGDTKKTNNNFSHRQVAIAYCVMKITITKDNAQAILLKYTKLKSSAKLIQKRITQPKNLMIISENKKVNTDKLRDLNEAKRLISGTKNKVALTEITRIITDFEALLRND